MNATRNEVAIQFNGSAAKAWLRALELTAPIAGNRNRILPVVIDEAAARFGEAPALLSDRGSLTYRALAERANQYARWALDQGLAKGDVVCLLMSSRPEYMAIWLGITSVGVVVSLLNTNLEGSSLAHCIRVVSPKRIIVAAELVDTLTATLSHVELSTAVWTYCTEDETVSKHRSRHRTPFRRATDPSRAARDRHRRSGAAYLHLRHNRAAQGRKRKPRPRHAMESLVRGHDGGATVGPDVQLPSDVSQRRRSAGARCGTCRRRRCRDSRKVFSKPVLERHRPLGLHAVPVHRRALPISAPCGAFARMKRTIGSGLPAATDWRPKSGMPLRTASAFLEFSNSMPQPKEASPCSTYRENAERSATSRLILRIDSRLPSWSSTWRRVNQPATSKDSAFGARRISLARRSAKS